MTTFPEKSFVELPGSVEIRLERVDGWGCSMLSLPQAPQLGLIVVPKHHLASLLEKLATKTLGAPGTVHPLSASASVVPGTGGKNNAGRKIVIDTHFHGVRWELDEQTASAIFTAEK